MVKATLAWPNASLITFGFAPRRRARLAKVLLENWRRVYNQIRPHSSLGNRPPAPETIRPFYKPESLTLGVVQ